MEFIKKQKRMLVYASIALLVAVALYFALNGALITSPQASVKKITTTKGNSDKILVSFANMDEFLESDELPDFAALADVKVKKRYFFEFVYRHAEDANDKIATITDKLSDLHESKDFDSEHDWIVDTSKRYKIPTEGATDTELVARLMKRAQPIPPSLVLAQAANESAWGTSRFAKKANNLFGQWCFTKGCGLVPKQRNGGAIHEVKTFDSPSKSVAAYIHNLNTGRAYQPLRDIRAKNKDADGVDLAAGLESYSERGDEYVKEIRSMIKFNKLGVFDERYTTD